MKIKDYLIVLSVLLVIASFLFYKLIDGAYLFTSGDSLSPIAVKNAIKLYVDSYGSFPLWFPWILGGIPTVHSFLSISTYSLSGSKIKVIGLNLFIIFLVYKPLYPPTSMNTEFLFNL